MLNGSCAPDSSGTRLRGGFLCEGGEYKRIAGNGAQKETLEAIPNRDLCPPRLNTSACHHFC